MGGNWNRHMIEFSAKRIVSDKDGKQIRVYLSLRALNAFRDFNDVRAYITKDSNRIKNLGRFKLHKRIKDVILSGKHYVLCDIVWLEE